MGHLSINTLTWWGKFHSRLRASGHSRSKWWLHLSHYPALERHSWVGCLVAPIESAMGQWTWRISTKLWTWLSKVSMVTQWSKVFLKDWPGPPCELNIFKNFIRSSWMNKSRATLGTITQQPVSRLICQMERLLASCALSKAENSPISQSGRICGGAELPNNWWARSRNSSKLWSMMKPKWNWNYLSRLKTRRR